MKLVCPFKGSTVKSNNYLLDLLYTLAFKFNKQFWLSPTQYYLTFYSSKSCKDNKVPSALFSESKPI